MKINFTKLRYLNNKILYYVSIVFGLFYFKYEPVLNSVLSSSMKITIWSVLIAILLFINSCFKSLIFILNVSLTKNKILIAFLQIFAVFLYMNLVSTFYIRIILKKKKLQKLLNNLLKLDQKTKLLNANNCLEPKTLILCLSARILYDFVRIIVVVFNLSFELVAQHSSNILEITVSLLIPILAFSIVNTIFYAITIHLVIVHKRLHSEVIDILELSLLSKKSKNLTINIEKSLSIRLKKVSLLYQDLVYNFYNLKELLEPSLFITINTLRFSFIADVATAYINVSQQNTSFIGSTILGFYLIVSYFVYLLCFLHGPQLLSEQVSNHYEIVFKCLNKLSFFTA